MAKKLSASIVNSLVGHGTIQEEDKEIYAFGIQQGAYTGISLLSAMIIGALFGVFWQSLIFLAAFIPMRIHAGGFHSVSQLRCYLYSISVIAIVLYLLANVSFSIWVSVPVVCISALLIFLLAPVEDPNKPLDYLENIVYKKRARRILVVLLTLWAVALVFQIDFLAYPITMVLALAAVLVCLGKIKLEVTNEKHQRA